MKNIDKRIIIIAVLSIIYITMCICYFKPNNNQSSNFGNFDKTMNKQKNTTIISTTAQVASALSETIELHATYYYSKSYYNINDKVKQGENIIKYKNGKYFTAPYDCVITEINVPESGSKITNEHYIKIDAINVLKLELKVDESKINKLSIGQKATITIEALDNQTYEGIITDISNTASDGKFTVVVEFDNDGNVLLGMTAKVTI